MNGKNTLHHGMAIACIILLFAFGLTGCAPESGAPASVETATELPASSPTDTPTASPTPQPTPSPTVAETESPSPAPEPTASPETAGEDGGNSYLLDHTNISHFILRLCEVSKGLDLKYDVGMISFHDGNITNTPSGRMVNVGMYVEENDQVMVGLGYNMDDEDMWYVSFEAPAPDQAEWYKKYFLATIVSLNNNPIPMADNSDDLFEFCDTLYPALVSDGKDKALKIGDYVFAYVNTSENRALFTVDSATFFDAFYKGKIELTDLNQ